MTLIHHRGTESTEAIIGAAIKVHRALGPGLLESAYQECLCRELSLRKRVGLLINFNVPLLKNGILRRVL
jgi:hypothetical protein